MSDRIAIGGGQIFTMRFLYGSVLTCLGAAGFAARGSDIGSTITNALQFTATQADALATSELVTATVFTDYSTTAGVWTKQSRSTWTSGFVPGIFWYLYHETGDAKWLTRAQSWTEGVRLRATESDNDTGFQIYESFGLGYELTGETNADYLSVMMTAANTFDTQRFNATIGCYRTWRNSSSDPVGNPSTTDATNNPNDMVFEVNADEMMNLELPLFVGTHGGNAGYVDHAIAHADRTWEVLVRPDGSTIHVAGFNADGTVRYYRSAQGWTTDSTWSRGQAWTVYGYTMVYRYTGLPRMLDHAAACFDYFMTALAAQSSDGVPYSDFDAPVDAQNPKDSSAAAIVASAAVELYQITGESKYRDAATNLLLALGSSGYLAQGTRYQPVLRRGSNRWGTSEVGTIFGDFYFLEAMLRYKDVVGISNPAETGRLINISTRGLAGTGDDVMIGGFIIAGGPRTVLIRGIGPALVPDPYNIPNALTDPEIELFDMGGNSIATNDDWSSSPDATAIEAASMQFTGFQLPDPSKDAAILINLPAGAYTVHLRGKSNETRVGLIEVYEAP